MKTQLARDLCLTLCLTEVSFYVPKISASVKHPIKHESRCQLDLIGANKMFT